MTQDNWLPAPIEKVYEALTVLADKRYELSDDKSSLKIFSSSGNKFYTLTYDPASRAMMSNDNAAFFKDEVSYPMVAYLMLLGELDYPESLLAPFAGIAWKDLLQKHKKKGKNDYTAGVAEVLENLKVAGHDTAKIVEQVEEIFQALSKITLAKLGPKKFPPRGY
jgi:hypothetical protein